MTQPIIDDLLEDATNAGLSPAEYVYIKVSATSFSLVTEQRVTDPVVETYQWLERLVAALIADRDILAEEHFDIALRLHDAEAERDAIVIGDDCTMNELRRSLAEARLERNEWSETASMWSRDNSRLVAERDLLQKALDER